MGTATKLTKAFVDSATTPGFYWDTELRGFGLRISGKTKSYFVQARVNGIDKRRTIGRHGVFTAEEARKHARITLAQMARGIDPKEAERERKTSEVSLAEVFEEYLKRGKLATRTEQDYKGYMAKYFGAWSRKPITSIKPGMVQDRHREIGAAHGGAQADVSMRFLRAVINFAEGTYTRTDGEPLISSNPTKRLSALKQWYRPHRRETYIKEECIARWYRATEELGSALPGSTEETVRDYLLMLLFTGLRRTEASLLRWENIDFDGRRFLLPRENTKNRTNFTLPLTTFTFELLKRRYAQKSSEFVFPGQGKTGHIVEPRPAMAKVIKASGIVFTLHDLRRTYATYADTVLDRDSTIKRLMNHLTGGQDVTEGYKQGIERLREPAQRVTNYILCLIEKEDLPTVVTAL